jgi:hypothetical protein
LPLLKVAEASVGDAGRKRGFLSLPQRGKVDFAEQKTDEVLQSFRNRKIKPRHLKFSKIDFA